MEAIVAQRKEKDKATGVTQISPDSQSEERRENGATAGVPLFLQTKRQPNGFASSSSKSTTPHIQRQADESEEEQEEELVQPKLQPKLMVGASDDPYERQADRVAERVTQVSGSVPNATSTGSGAVGIQRETVSEPEEEEVIQAKSVDTGAGQAAGAGLQKTVSSPGLGSPLSEGVRSSVEPVLGSDLSHARVHNNSASHAAAKSINAKAFTHGNNIWLGAGQRENDLGLMAHEATHVVQQTAPSISRKLDDRIQRQAATPAAGEPASTTAPEEVELKGATNLDAALSENNKAWIGQQKRKRGKVKVKFGKLAKGEVEVKKSGKHYRVNKGAIPLSHPVFKRISDDASGLAPHLAVNTSKNGTLSGFVAPGAVAKRSSELSAVVKKAPDIMGLVGFSLPRLPLVNKLENGELRLGVKDAAFELGSVFSGQFSLEVVNEAVSFSGQATVVVTGLAQGDLSLARNENGLITGSATVAVSLPKNISGSVTLDWDGKDISGKGKVGYQGEKLSGDVLLNVMDKEKAAQLENGKKAPEGEVPVPAKKEKKSKKRELVVFGEGNLDFAFTEWLTGTAQVIIDPKGHLTVIGKITPQKEFELFPQKDYNKELFKLEARASYGIPVVGNIFIFANIGMNAFAKLGPAKFYKIEVGGTYSTDPEKSKDFSIRGSLNISAAAGLQLRGEAGAGLEILAHDIKAGAGINAMAGIRGYAEATPIIGYREKPGALGEDKKGEFFLRGELEIAAQPFLGLSGDLFVEIDAPWWSPVPDKRWTWPLGGKEWPIGGEFGMGANVDYVFGSGQWPSLEFKPVDFDADKFMTDLYSDKAASKSDKGEKQGKWKEKNSKAAEPPAKDGKGGGALPGKASALPNAKPKVSPGTTKPSSKQVDPNAKTADGKTVKEYQDEANKKQGKPDKKDTEKGGKEQPSTKGDEKLREERKQKAVKKVRSAMSKGIRKSELQALLKSLKQKYSLKRAELDANDDVVVVNSDPVKVKGEPLAVKEVVDSKGKKTLKKDSSGDIVFGKFTPSGRSGLATMRQKAEDAFPNETFPYADMDRSAFKPSKVTAEFYGFKSGIGDSSRDSNMTGKVGNMGNLEERLKNNNDSDQYQGGHLVGHQFGGPDSYKNLVPQSRGMNLSAFAKVENIVKQNLPAMRSKASADEVAVTMVVTPKYESSYRVSLLDIAKVLRYRLGKQSGQIKNKVKARKAAGEKAGSLEKKQMALESAHADTVAYQASVEASDLASTRLSIPSRIARSMSVELTVSVDDSQVELKGFDKQNLEKQAENESAKVTGDYKIVSEGASAKGSPKAKEAKSKKKIKANFDVSE